MNQIFTHIAGTVGKADVAIDPYGALVFVQVLIQSGEPILLAVTRTAAPEAGS